ncbi:MAG: hypothetical protein U0931_31295 [Vulcanimicrobiota bacterium]
MELYRVPDALSVKGVCLAAGLTGAMSAAIGICYASVVGYFPPTSFWLGVGAMLLFGGLLGKGLTRVLHIAELRSKLVADLLAILAITVCNWSAWITWLFRDRNDLIWRPDQIWRASQEIALSVPNHSGLYIYQALVFAFVAGMCFHNLKWRKHGYCDSCKQWLEPVKEFGPYRYSKDILLQLQAMEQFRADALPAATSKAWKWCSLMLAACPKCRQFSILQVLKWERHPLGVASNVLGFLAFSAVEGPEVGPSTA